MERLQVVIPMTGTGERFKRAGYRDPKPLILADERPIIAHVIDRFPKDARFVFICNEDHLKTTEMETLLRKSAPNGKIVSIPPHKKGPVYAVDQASEWIDDQLPTVVNYCDFSFVWDPEHFYSWTQRSKVDGAVVCYRGFHPHYFGPTNYAYCRTDNGDRVLEVREKENFTDDRTKEFASSGTYYFKSGALVKKFFRQNLEEGPDLKGEYYVSLVYNHLIQAQLDVRVYEIDQFLQWGTPQDLEDWQYWNRAFQWVMESPQRPLMKAENVTLLLPMAGLGSRFKDLDVPKPLVPLKGEPLFLAAARAVPQTDRQVFIYRKEMEPEIAAHLAHSKDESIVLQEPTDGQATTCASAIPRLRALAKTEEGPLWITTCDHGFALTQKTVDLLEERDPDVAIVGVRHYPGARRTPKAFAYLDADPGFSPIRSVSVKVPLSETPEKDPILVGTFYFKSKQLFCEKLEALLEKNIRVNGERYLDSIVNLCVEDGLDVQMLDSPGYYCWGTPEALGEYRYWHRYFCGTGV